MSNRQRAIALYVLGFFIVGLGVNVMNSSDLGVGAWDTVTFNLHGYMTTILGISWVTVGMMSFLISFLFMIVVMSYRRQKRYLWLFIPILLVFGSVDFWHKIIFHEMYVGVDFWITGITVWGNDLTQYLFFLVGSLILPLGLTLVVKSGFTAFVIDEFMLMMMDVFHTKSIMIIRLGIELLGLTIGTMIGYVTYYASDGDFGSANIGTLIFTILFSTIMGMWFSILKVKRL